MTVEKKASHIVGVDIGSTTIKLVCFDVDKKIIGTKLVRSCVIVKKTTSALIEKVLSAFLHELGLGFGDVEKLVLTGVGASFVEGNIDGLNVIYIDELQAMGRGGLYLSGLDKAIVVSLGTGSAFVKAEGESFTHLGGSCLGAAAIEGLSLLTIDENDTTALSQLARGGHLENIDLIMEDVSKDVLSFLPMNATAAHFGKVSKDSAREDIARGIINMVFQTIALFAVFTSRGVGITDVVLTGGLTMMEQARHDFEAVGNLYNIRFIIPEHSPFAIAIGACLSYM